MSPEPALLGSLCNTALVKALLAVLLIVAADPVMATELGQEPHAVVRGHPPGGDAEVVALCPDITERSEVFTARDGDGLAGSLARAGYRVYLVDPWSSSQAQVRGFDAVVREVYPALLADLARRGGGGQVTWIGHGLCGFLPVAAAARPDQKLPQQRWVALGTRFSWTLPSPLLLRWLRSWQANEVPLPELVARLLFTGLRPRSGPRPSSAPAQLDQARHPAEVLQAVHSAKVARPPPRALVEDLLRWFEQGAARDREGWVDYSTGLASIAAAGLLVAGASDPLAPPEDVLPALRSLAADSVTQLLVLSRGNGDLEEYGHLGMLLSRHSARDVDGSVVQWLRRGRP
ncbi:MAG: hypothetical protein CMP23_06650 [Rickettsiales bacterium]|nr:hypothetical protein [Rickettsiales bacterium]